MAKKGTPNETRLHTQIFTFAKTENKMKDEIAYKSTPATEAVKGERNDDKLHIKFYALAFGNVDSYGDIIMPTACDAYMASEEKSRIKLCYQHDTREVIGVITDMKVDEYGLLCEADILPTTKGKDVQTLIEAGAINEFSIGYYATKYHYEKREGYDYDLRILDEIGLTEISPVTRAANPKAILLDAKSDDFKSALKEMTDDEIKAAYKAIETEFYIRFFNYL